MIPVSRDAEGVRRFLAAHRVPTLNISGILMHEPRLEVFADRAEDPRGLLVKGPWFWYVHSEEETFLEAVLEEMRRKDGFYQFSGTWRPVARWFQERLPLVWHAPCDVYVLPEGGQVPPQADSPAVGARLEDAEIIDAHYAYRHSGSLEKIRKCIEHRPSSAIYVEDQPVCWLLVHEDESMGIMYTLEEHRRKGYALDVSLDLVDKQLRAGRTPYLQIRDDNAMSPGLALKCGFHPVGQCDWFGVTVGTPPELVEGGEAFRKRAEEAGWPGMPGADDPCCVRFLYVMKPGPAESNLVEEVSAEAWLAFAERHLDGSCLRMAVESLGQDLRLLGEVQEGALVHAAALLVDDDDGFELLWTSTRETSFLERVLLRAKDLKLGTVFAHGSDLCPTLEAIGFRRLVPHPDSRSRR